MDQMPQAGPLLDEVVDGALQAPDRLRIPAAGPADRGTYRHPGAIGNLAVVSEGVHRGRSCDAIHRNHFDSEVPPDGVPVTEAALERYAGSLNSVVKSALDVGPEL